MNIFIFTPNLSIWSDSTFRIAPYYKIQISNTYDKEQEVIKLTICRICTVNVI